MSCFVLGLWKLFGEITPTSFLWKGSYMKHYVLGLVFNKHLDTILLIDKLRPEWMKGRWNGIGGKVEENENPMNAMTRECKEETGVNYTFAHVLTFTCPGGTVFVFMARSGQSLIPHEQIEDETLSVFATDNLPGKVMTNLKWIIPVCKSNIDFPFMVHQYTLGVDGEG